MRRLWISIFLIIGVLVGILGYKWFLASPYYTLYQVRSAIKDHDWERFCMYVDVNKVSTNLARDMAKITEKALDTEDLPALLSKGLGALLIIKMKPSIMNDIRSWVVREDKARRKGMLESILPDRDSTKGGEVKISLNKVTFNDDRAFALVGLGSGAAEIELNLEMEKKERHWRIIKIANILEIIKEAAEDRKAKG